MTCFYSSTVSSLPFLLAIVVTVHILSVLFGLWLGDQLRVARLRIKRRMRGIA